MLDQFVTKVIQVQAVKITVENIKEAAELCGAWLDADKKSNPYFVLDIGHDRQVIGRPGAWLVKGARGWVVMKDTRFRHYYERVSTYSFEIKEKN